MRLHASRGADFRHGKPLGPRDRLVTWQKPPRKARTATRKLGRTLPAQLTLRLIRHQVVIPGFRREWITLATTRLDPVRDPAAELAELDLRRWQVELFLRRINPAEKRHRVLPLY